MTHNQKVLALLQDGKPHTHHELYDLRVVAHSRVADLRRMGHHILCWTETTNGERVSVYQLRAVQSPETSLTDGETVGARASGPLGEVSPGLAVGRELRAAGKGAFSSPPEHPHQLSVWEAA